jgi:hypothetical protein
VFVLGIIPLASSSKWLTDEMRFYVLVMGRVKWRKV